MIAVLDDSVIIVTCNSDMCMGGFPAKGCHRFRGEQIWIRSIINMCVYMLSWNIFNIISKEEANL